MCLYAIYVASGRLAGPYRDRDASHVRPSSRRAAQLTRPGLATTAGERLPLSRLHQPPRPRRAPARAHRRDRRQPARQGGTRPRPSPRDRRHLDRLQADRASDEAPPPPRPLLPALPPVDPAGACVLHQPRSRRRPRPGALEVGRDVDARQSRAPCTRLPEGLQRHVALLTTHLFSRRLSHARSGVWLRDRLGCQGRTAGPRLPARP